MSAPVGTKIRDREPQLMERAGEILAEELKERDVSRSAARAAINVGFGLALHYARSLYEWPESTSAEVAAAAVGRAMLRLVRLEGLPMENLGGLSALSVTRELLE